MKQKLFLIFFLVLCINASAQWTYNPETPLSLTDKKECRVHLISTHSSGVTYVAYAPLLMRNNKSTFDLYLTKLDVNGNRMWTQDALVCSKYTGSSSSYSNMQVLDDASVIICFYDRENKEMWNLSVYKINPDGTLAWGPTGVQITNSSTSNNYPAYVMALSDGSVVVSWMEEGVKLLLQKINPDGTFAWTTPKTMASTTLMVSTGLCLADKDDNFYITYTEQKTRGTYNFKIQRVDKDGNKLWTAPVSVTKNRILATAAPIPTTVVADGDGGIFTCLATQEAGSSKGVIYLQQVNADGKLRYPEEGLQIANNSTKYFKSPVIYYHKDREIMLVSWTEADAGQTKYGLGIQKINLVSDRLEWGAEGQKIRDLITSSDVVTGNISMDDDENIYITYQEYMPGSAYSYAKVKKTDLNLFPVWEDDFQLTKPYYLTLVMAGSYKEHIVIVWKDDKTSESFIQKCKIGD